MDISIITAFYYGNAFMDALVENINNVAHAIKNSARVELVIVNDSPEVSVLISNTKEKEFELTIINNAVNMGIQKTRVAGLKVAKGDWIVFLDQDDELKADGFCRMIECCDYADIIVGNLLYEYDGKQIKFYKNDKVLKHAIKFRNFLMVRNMIPSPGHCLIKKEKIPDLWKKKPLINNGADDYLLWILMFKMNCKFKTVGECVYQHNDNGGNNLSLNIDKMYSSSKEMISVLKTNSVLTKSELRKLERCVEFKHLQDGDGLSLKKKLEYCDVIMGIAGYKLGMLLFGWIG